MNDQPASDAVVILRRIEPLLHGIQKDLAGLQVAIAERPRRAELWGAMAVMVALFALSLAGLAILLQHLHP